MRQHQCSGMVCLQLQHIAVADAFVRRAETIIENQLAAQPFGDKRAEIREIVSSELMQEIFLK